MSERRWVAVGVLVLTWVLFVVSVAAFLAAASWGMVGFLTSLSGPHPRLAGVILFFGCLYAIPPLLFAGCFGVVLYHAHRTMRQAGRERGRRPPRTEERGANEGCPDDRFSRGRPGTPPG